MIFMGYNKIFCIGLNKTGTKSLSDALTILGFKSFHGNAISNIMEYNFQANRKLLGGTKSYDAYSNFCVSTIPGIYRILDEQYPGSKFILTIRDLYAWLVSREQHVLKNMANPFYKGTWLKVDKKRWIQEYNEYNKKVKKYFKDRHQDFLVLDICGGDAWEKLCPFLGMTIPDVSFPNTNKKSQNITRAGAHAKRIWRRVKTKIIKRKMREYLVSKLRFFTPKYLNSSPPPDFISNGEPL